jgi:hypothetical protein
MLCEAFMHARRACSLLLFVSYSKVIVHTVLYHIKRAVEMCVTSLIRRCAIVFQPALSSLIIQSNAMQHMYCHM